MLEISELKKLFCAISCKMYQVFSSVVNKFWKHILTPYWDDLAIFSVRISKVVKFCHKNPILFSLVIKRTLNCQFHFVMYFSPENEGMKS